MDHREYRAALAKLGLTQKEVSRLVDVDERTGRRWA
jgi:DNA-binding XRE family transcriptional regulator